MLCKRRRRPRPLIFLDFDETLVQTFSGYRRGGYFIYVEGPLTVFVRPGARRFVEQLAHVADVYLYSGGKPRYLAAALAQTGLAAHLAGCFSLYDDNFADFRTLGLQYRPWLLIDDTPFTGALVQGKLLALGVPYVRENYVHVRGFQGHAHDVVLLDGRLLGRVQSRLRTFHNVSRGV